MRPQKNIGETKIRAIFCSNSCSAYSSRVIYSISRDGRNIKDTQTKQEKMMRGEAIRRDIGSRLLHVQARNLKKGVLRGTAALID
jgi:hypothetical protein